MVLMKELYKISGCQSQSKFADMVYMEPSSVSSCIKLDRDITWDIAFDIFENCDIKLILRKNNHEIEIQRNTNAIKAIINNEGNYDIDEFANKSKVYTRTVTEWIKGCNPRIKTIARIADVFGYEVVFRKDNKETVYKGDAK